MIKIQLEEQQIKRLEKTLRERMEHVEIDLSSCGLTVEVLTGTWWEQVIEEHRELARILHILAQTGL